MQPNRGSTLPMYKVTFNNKNKVFFNTLKSAVDQYFHENKIKKTGNWKLYTKTLVLIPLAMLCYAGLLFLPLNIFAGIGLSALLGIITASIGFNVMHDSCHGSFSSKGWLNDSLGLISMNALGGNAFFWKIKHNIIHHTYTNVDGIDDDINNMPFVRECSTQPWRPIHRWQHYYMFLLYGFTTLVWMFIGDYKKYFTKQVYTTEVRTMNFKEHVIFWISKLLYIVFYIAVPVYLLGWGPWAIGFITMHLVLGFTLAVVFQLAHVVEDTGFEAAGFEPKKIENEWAIHQVKTTANFAEKDKFVSWFVGGLNFQIEHHLFPRISHIHYPAISRIVRETCSQFDIQYNYYPTMLAAVASHYRTMKQLGSRP